ncbi:ATP-dependent RNA helicase DbpA [Chitinasiproducens palmae]|uniref:ATP-dependent RNA helicase DbpA n=1 Tax=Chitinasiproducens palmae TaxID=1770053 RepID=A0A1H2PK59_9BURK|nr:ATP-dependent RNA helicase DbpA [Chitinasiproducens palmae]SDV46755.1 ATP-dependent RNA helicase DbpA [Chitinasiproducens palmae]
MSAQPPQSTDHSSSLDFASLDLPAPVLENLARLGYATMTPIQAASLPLALSGRDILAQAKTGSGKTAAFGLALLARIDVRAQDAAGPLLQGLVLCPTRELAEQVSQELRRLARAEDNVKILTLCGGTPMRPQLASLEHGAHVVVGTPGRILDVLGRGALRCATLRTLVLDEADRMLDMGFHDDIVAIADQCPPERQTLLFSATYPEGIARLGRRFLRQPVEVKLAEQHDARTISERFYEVDEDQRLHAVGLLLNHFRPTSTLAFCNTRQRCRDLVEVLNAQGFEAVALHGELDQRDRDQVLIRFANRSVSVLVATDVAARGLDIAQLEAVINVDVTPEAEVHVHRIGRTGRADAQGAAYTLVSVDEMGRAAAIEAASGRSLKWHTLAELTPADGGRLRPPMTTLQILGGRKEKIRPGDVLGALTGEAGLPASSVGKIAITDMASYVAIAREQAAEAVKRLSEGKLKGRKVKARLL